MAEEKGASAEEGGGGGKKKLIVIIAVAVVLLLGAGGAAFFLLGGEDETTADGETAEEAPAVAEGDPVYHKFDPNFVVSLPPGGPAKMLQVAIQVMTRHPTVVETLGANDPMIRHHLINLLEEQSAADLLTAKGKTALQTAILDTLTERLAALKEPGEIRGVFFTEFVLQ
jgi:flagellar FliL protein